MFTQGRAVGTRLGMYVLHILKTKQNKAFVLTVQENSGTIGQGVSKWDSLGITGQLSNKQEASNMYWCSGIHAYLNREVGWRRWQKSKSLDIFKEE